MTQQSSHPPEVGQTGALHVHIHEEDMDGTHRGLGYKGRVARKAHLEQSV